MKLIKKVSSAAQTPKSTDLRSIMDYNALFEIYYSGVEYEGYYDICYDCGIRHFLMSYHYIQNRRINMQERFGDSNIKLLVDSGAHTYQNDPKYLEKTHQRNGVKK